MDRDAQLAQPLADPLAVGVERLPADQLAPDRDDLRFHRPTISPAVVSAPNLILSGRSGRWTPRPGGDPGVSHRRRVCCNRSMSRDLPVGAARPISTWGF